MRQHIDLVAWLNIASGAFGLLCALIAGGVVGGLGLFSGDAQAAGIMALIGAFVAVLLGLLSVPALVGGIGLLKRKPWSRILVLMVSFLSLPGFPVGTLIGGYSIWVLMEDETRRILSGTDSHPRR